jgi:hypothetical protein
VRTRSGAVALIVAAAALAIQPDRAMAGALAVVLAALALRRPDPMVLSALAAAAIGFAITLIRADVQPAVPFVDQILFRSFDVHWLAGMAVTGGAVVMLLPAIRGLSRDPGQGDLHVAFGALWLAVIAAAALGNYPTPLVGYGGSAILGYLLSLAAFPARTAIPSLERDGASPGMERPGARHLDLSVA